MIQKLLARLFGRKRAIALNTSITADSSIDTEKLQQAIRGVVRSEIARQQRPGGQLYEARFTPRSYAPLSDRSEFPDEHDFLLGEDL